jgi:hypothetical protein
MNCRIWLGRLPGTWLPIWSNCAGHESSVRWRQLRGVGGVLGVGEDVRRCLTYIGKSLGFVLGFRVGS